MSSSLPTGRAATPAPNTIVGVATGTPDGGVAVVRLSGPDAVALAEALGATVPPERRLARRKLRLGVVGDEDALVVFMPGPSSYTGEDVVELHIHAGMRNVSTVVAALLEAGAKAAGPGDFTHRAFANGRMSLEQAEGVAAVIGAQTDEALRQARQLAGGELGRTVDARREAIADLQAEIEANLDFPEDVESGDFARWEEELAGLIGHVERWLGGFEAGRRARERARFVLAGPPNAGKSSLFNALLRRSRALVAEMPGTTRDYVEAELRFGPHAAVLVDTAGLRETGESVEAAGIALSKDQIEGADLVIWLRAADQDDDQEANEGPPEGATVIRVETKRDLGERRSTWLGVSLQDGERRGVDELEAQLHAWFRAGGDSAWIGLARHRDRAREALDFLARARVALRTGAPLEVCAFELAGAERRLGEITGRTALGPVSEDVLARIFAKFCIGK